MMWWTPKFKLKSFGEGEDVTLLPENDDNHRLLRDAHGRIGRMRWWILTLTVINIALFSIAILIIFTTSSSRTSPPICSVPQSAPKLNAGLKELSSYSPIMDALNITTQTVHFDGTFFNNTSIYRADPSPAVDAAWSFLSHSIWPINSSDILRVQKDPHKSVKIDPKFGLGEDTYIASFGFVHQIHCLDTLRKEIHYNAYWKQPPSELHIAHRNHCLHMLLQSIMCHADVDVITYEWTYVEDRESGERKYSPWPDFNMVKKCRDFDAVYGYLERSVPGVAEELHREIRKPDGTPARSLYET